MTMTDADKGGTARHTHSSREFMHPRSHYLVPALVRRSDAANAMVLDLRHSANTLCWVNAVRIPTQKRRTKLSRVGVQLIA